MVQENRFMSLTKWSPSKLATQGTPARKFRLIPSNSGDAQSQVQLSLKKGRMLFCGHWSINIRVGGKKEWKCSDFSADLWYYEVDG